MKKKYLIIVCIVAIFCFEKIVAQIRRQEIKVIYKLKVESESNSKVTKHKDVIEKLYQAYSQLEFELVSNSEIGVYKYVKKLEIGEDDIIYQLAVNHGGGNSIYFRTIEKKIEHINDFGKKINVVYDPNELNWEITDETKSILGYTCYKAVGYKEQYDPGRKKLLTFSPVAWFAPELNMPFGPNGIDGLPGLVLEGSMNGKLFLYADKIEINTNLKNERKLMIDSGEEMTEKEYLELLQKMRPIPN
ncbi:GLPGLI family protein [Flagellimonas aequoris]|uniref:GLPGLI family protein n=1 Tax=Flagellimonas aequoris TaxID=2306997 RepID=A0A418N7G0_9FLAO|nr:GLPGLI family protein [Allomuricauda aequoris]RIV70829.1 GLPGLI family protein [Allomuricauda aequoris]TXK02267.1 GLPGLI family protein [Allomuricauda aequoris]